jgi:hypothetical protein
VVRRGHEHHGAVRSPLLQLGQDLRRDQARTRRAWMRYRGASEGADPEGAAKAHQAWSNAVEDTLRIVEIISREQPRDLAGLLIQYEAIHWWISEDDSVLDTSTRRWLRDFGGQFGALLSEAEHRRHRDRVEGTLKQPCFPAAHQSSRRSDRPPRPMAVGCSLVGPSDNRSRTLGSGSPDL